MFRPLIRHMAFDHREAIIPNIRLIGHYGRFDDLHSLVGTPVEDEMWSYMKSRFDKDPKATIG